MAELTEQQLERAKQELAKVFGGPVDDVLMTNMLRTAAPFLQIPWDEPSDAEIAEITRQHWHWKDGAPHISETVRFVAGQFVQRRNAALMPKPVDPRIEIVGGALCHASVLHFGHSLGRREATCAAEIILAALDEVKP